VLTQNKGKGNGVPLTLALATVFTPNLYLYVITDSLLCQKKTLLSPATNREFNFYGRKLLLLLS
jgi:hypothetical protein